MVTVTGGYEQATIVTATRTTVEAWRTEIAITPGTVPVGGERQEGNPVGGEVSAALEVSARIMMRALATVAAADGRAHTLEVVVAAEAAVTAAVAGGAVVRRRGKSTIAGAAPPTTGTAAAGGTRTTGTGRTKDMAVRITPVITTTTVIAEEGRGVHQGTTRMSQRTLVTVTADGDGAGAGRLLERNGTLRGTVTGQMRTTRGTTAAAPVGA